MMNVLSKKVETYLNIQGKDIKDFKIKIQDEYGDIYYTDNKADFVTGNILGISEDGQEFNWFRDIKGR